MASFELVFLLLNYIGGCLIFLRFYGPDISRYIYMRFLCVYKVFLMDLKYTIVFQYTSL